MIRIFLSHSSHKNDLVHAIKNNLPEYIQSWVDEFDLLAGENIGRSIRTTIDRRTDFVVPLIDANAANSDWVLKELRWARQRETTLGRPFILPIVIDSAAWEKVKPYVGNRKYIPCPHENDPQSVAKQLAAALWDWMGRLFELAANKNGDSDRQDLVTSFWEPYVDSGRPTRIFYPEPQFFRDDRHTYMGNEYAGEQDRKEVFSYLNLPGGIAPSYSFVSSGIVRAMLQLIDCLHKRRIKVRAQALRPTMPFEHSDENVIILGTPGMMALISILEAPYRFHTQRDGVTVESGEGDAGKTLPVKLTDDTQENMSASKVHLNKWAVFTRRPHVHPDNITTVLAAPHGRSIEAVAGFLTRSPELSDLSGLLATQNKFPRQMQVLFRVPMLKTDGEPHIEQPEVHEALDLDRAYKVVKRRPTV
jgi:hypothetical protein